MNNNFLSRSILAGLLLTSVLANAQQKEMLLWPNGAPGSEGKTGNDKIRIAQGGEHVYTNIHKPSITVYLPAKEIANGAAIIVAPGGGHSALWIDHEGHNPAKFISDKGIAVFVLKYRLAKDSLSTYTVDKDELADIQRAIRLVHSRAKEWGVDTARLGVMGFSAGGELAGLAAMHFDDTNQHIADAIDRETCRPAFQALIYPGNSSRLSTVKNAPPLFLLGGFQDRKDIAVGIAQLYMQYKEAGIPAELHIYAKAGHGFGVRPTNKGAVSNWMQRLVDWMGDMGYLHQ